MWKWWILVHFCGLFSNCMSQDTIIVAQQETHSDIRISAVTEGPRDAVSLRVLAMVSLCSPLN